MSIRIYNPPAALLCKGTKDGVEIGGALSIIAMDRDHNLHIAENLLSELSWGEFWKEEAISDQIESITIKLEDNKALYDPNELTNRIINTLAKIRANHWILFGVANFESNIFQDELLIEGINFSYVESLMNEHKRARDENKFPQIFDESVNRYISAKFNGSRYQLFHIDPSVDLFTIFAQYKQLAGSVTGIVCTSQGAANFYIINENIHRIGKEEKIQVDTLNLEKALALIKNNVIYPISWFKLDVGLSALKNLSLWPEIKDNPLLKKSLLGYFQYVKGTLKEEHEELERLKAQERNEEINLSLLSESEKAVDMKSIEEILNLKDLGLFKDPTR